MAKVELSIDFPLRFVEHYTAQAENAGCGVEDYMSAVLTQRPKAEIKRLETGYDI